MFEEFADLEETPQRVDKLHGDLIIEGTDTRLIESTSKSPGLRVGEFNIDTDKTKTENEI